MNLFLRSASFFDKKNILNYRLWKFSLLNANRYFPYYFLFKLILNHPLKFIKGFRFYQKLAGRSKEEPLLGTISFQQFIKSYIDRKNKGRTIIAPGFCMKPYDNLRKKSTCPVGQANHDCFLLDRPALLSAKQKSWPLPCIECGIGKLIKAGAKLKVDFYIMTSAIDIARDLFLPSTKSKEVCMGLFFLCPYSTEAFTFGLALSGMSGAVVTFGKGDCSNHQEWTRADMGIKNEQTFVDTKIFTSLINELSRIAENIRVNKSVNYTKENNVYVYKN